MNLRTAKSTFVALAVLHNMAIDMKEGTDLVRWIPRHNQRQHAPQDTIRGNIVRRNFIQQHF